jgi:hypothetical protein
LPWCTFLAFAYLLAIKDYSLSLQSGYISSTQH